MTTKSERTRQRSEARNQPPPPTKRSPVLLVTVAAVAIGLLLIAVLAITGGLPGGGSSGAIATPVIGTPPGLAHGRTLGSADAPIDIQVWADFQCPVCARYARDIEPFLVGQYVETGKARLTFNDYSFIGPESFDAAVAARVAGESESFWPYHDLLFANQGAENSGAFSRSRLADMAVAAGLDRQAFLTAMDDPTHLAAVKDETARGQALGVTATPTTIINGQMTTGLPDLAALGTYLDSLVAASSPGSSSAP
jgi:protein-disulfide isomerase